MQSCVIYVREMWDQVIVKKINSEILLSYKPLVLVTWWYFIFTWLVSVSAGLLSKGVALAAHYTYREQTESPLTLKHKENPLSGEFYYILLSFVWHYISFHTDALLFLRLMHVLLYVQSADHSLRYKFKCLLDCVLQFERSQRQTMQTTDTVMRWYSCFFLWTYLSSSAIFVSFSPWCLLIVINFMKRSVMKHCQSTDELYL